MVIRMTKLQVAQYQLRNLPKTSATSNQVPAVIEPHRARFSEPARKERIRSSGVPGHACNEVIERAEGYPSPAKPLAIRATAWTGTRWFLSSKVGSR
jgi:hypothetical protein